MDGTCKRSTKKRIDGLRMGAIVTMNSLLSHQGGDEQQSNQQNQNLHGKRGKEEVILDESEGVLCITDYLDTNHSFPSTTSVAWNWTDFWRNTLQ